MRLVKKRNPDGTRKKIRSKFELQVMEQIDKTTKDYSYESMRIKYSPPPKIYTPDIVLANGIIIELKGYFTSEDRAKHLLVKEQHPELDIRFVFQRAANKLHKKSTTTYGSWCDKYGFKWADKEVPAEWLVE